MLLTEGRLFQQRITVQAFHLRKEQSSPVQKKCLQDRRHSSFANVQTSEGFGLATGEVKELGGSTAVCFP